MFFSAIGASHHSRTRFFRAKALAQEAVEASPIGTTVFAPSIVYSPGDPWVTLLERISLLPAMPISGSGQALLPADLGGGRGRLRHGGARNGRGRPGAFELAGPETLTYDEIVRAALRSRGRRRPLLHVPLPVVRAALRALGRVSGPEAFATWEEAELMEEPMITPRGTADAEALGVTPLRWPRCSGRLAPRTDEGPPKPGPHRNCRAAKAAYIIPSMPPACRPASRRRLLLRHLGHDRLGGQDVLRRSTRRSAAPSA